MANRNKKADKAVELKGILNYKTGPIFNRKTLEARISDVKKIRDKNIEKYNREVASIRQSIIDAMSLQDRNKKIANENLKIYEENIKQEKMNLNIATDNLVYLTALLEEVNETVGIHEKTLFEINNEIDNSDDESEGF